MKIFLAILLFLNVIQLQSQTIAITEEKLNVFYKGLDNPITVVVENCSCENIRVKASVGEISGAGCHYSYHICDALASTVIIYVGVTKKGVVNWIDTIMYRLKNADEPLLSISGLTDDVIDKEQLCNSCAINATNNNSKIFFWVESYSIEISRNNSVLWTSENISGSKFQKNFIDYLRDICGPGDEIRLYNIYVTGKDCIHREFKEMKFKLK